jgi:hypothetical protein
MPRSSVTARMGAATAPAGGRVSIAATGTPAAAKPRASVTTPVMTAPGNSLIATSSTSLSDTATGTPGPTPGCVAP